MTVPASTNLKAIVAAVITGLSALVASLNATPDTGSLHVVDWVIIILSAVVAGGVVWRAPNAPTGA